jgi:hypothetical protein
MTSFDAEELNRVVAASLSGPGGVGLVVNVFAGIGGVIHTPAKRGVFRSEPERILIGNWRYEVAPDGRLHAAHVVNGIVIGEETLAAGVVGAHLTHALEQIVARYGPSTIPSIDAAVEALRASCGGV